MAKINAIHAAWSRDATPLVIPDSAEEFLNAWIDADGAGCCDMLGITASWWAHRAAPNVLLLHYSHMLADLPGTVRALAEFVGGVDVAALDVDRVVARSSFEYMSGNAEKMAPFGGGHLTVGPRFLRQGPRPRLPHRDEPGAD